MNIQEIKDVLSKVSFSPSNLDMGWDWDIKPTKIFDDSGVMIEKGFSIRTTFMRPDVNTGEMDKGYGRWMFIPENVSVDGLVKTAWVCAELIVKHELMEAFLYEKSRIFDPHKSISDLQYNARKVDRVGEKVVYDVGEDVKVEDVKVEDQSEVVTSEKLFHKQNIDNHTKEITDYLDKNLIKKNSDLDPSIKSNIQGYIVMTNTVFHNPSERMVRLVNSSNGKIIDFRSDTKYTLSDVKDMLNDLVIKSYMADPAEINQKIHSAGFTIGEPKDDFWVFKNPDIDGRYIVHSENDRSLAVINQNGDIIRVGGSDMVYENEDYTMGTLKKILTIIRK